jgi:hypothetical protein
MTMKTLKFTTLRAGSRSMILMVLAAILCLSLANTSRVSVAGSLPGTGETLLPLVQFGEVVFGSIGAPGQTQEYTFMANAGDVILIRASRETGDLWPRIQLRGPGGELLRDDHSPVHVELTVKVPRGGTHRIQVSDGFDEEGVGTYRLYLQRLNDAGASTPLSFGHTAGGAIAQAAEMDAFTFSAEEGDIILTRVSADPDTGDLWPEVRLYDPAGELLNKKHDPSHAEFTTNLPARYYAFLPAVLRARGFLAAGKPGTATGASFEATHSGTYTVLVGDGFNGTLTGPYGLYVQRLNGPGNTSGLSFGELHSSTILQAAEMDTYTFAGSAGDKVLVAINRVSGDLHSEIRLYDPTGSLINTAKDATHAEATGSLPVTGTYTLLVGDGFWGSGTGEYNLYLQRLNDPENATPLSFGKTVSGAILEAAEMDAYTFSAAGGDQVQVGMTRASGSSLWPEVRLYDPGGSLIATDSESVSAELTQTLAAGGSYTILCAGGLNGTSTGSYDLQLEKLSSQ